MAEAMKAEAEVMDPRAESEVMINKYTRKADISSKLKVRKEDDEKGPFDHPVYKKLSRLNGDINKMTKDDLKKKLESLDLDPRGVKEVLKKRLKAYYKRTKFQKAGLRSGGGAYYDYYLVIDFEATCDEGNGHEWPHEIIEFPVVLIDGKAQEVVDEFHSFVRPLLKPRLTKFCTDLTGITQGQVDKSPVFTEVLDSVQSWIEKHQLGRRGRTMAVVTDGPWDMGRFMFLQCQMSKLAFPQWARKWVNLRKAYCNFYKFKKAKLITMLENLGMTFQGHQHSGLDDTRNIARIALHMLQDGSPLRINERVFEHKLQELSQYKSLEVVNVKPEDDMSSGSENEASPWDDLGIVFESGKEVKRTQKHDCESNHSKSKDQRSLEGQMKHLNLESKEKAYSEEEEDAYDDLLAYYALQNPNKG